MPPLNYLSISIGDVYQRVGLIERSHVSQSDVRPKKPFEAKQYGLLVYWPRSVPWLDLRLRHGDPGIDFKEDRDGLVAVCEQVGADPDHVAPPNFLQGQAFQTAFVSREASITLSVRIDTDHEAFRQAVQNQEGALEREEFLQTVQVRFFDAKQLGVYLDQEGTITLILKPALPVPPHDGFAAIDLGNTSSTMVGMSMSQAFYRTDNIRVVNADAIRGEMREYVEPIVSNVRIDRVRSYEPPPPGVRRFPSVPKDDYPQTINWVAGRLANPLDGSAGDTAATTGLVLGAKRLIAGKDWEKTQKLFALHRHTYQRIEQMEQIDVLNRLPAELLVCRLMQRFREAANAWPRSLAITYPTTYSPRELEQLREVVQRAWLRMQSRLQTQIQGYEEQPDPDAELESNVRALQQLIAGRRLGHEPGEDPVIRLMVDEASAAAFFFLYRRIFEEPGGLPRFRYLFPNGLVILLYDCGGGTTDIALVRASFDPEAADVLRINVLARSGLRGFGGDDLTRAVCRVLKAKLALKVAETRNRPIKLNWPAAPTAHTPERPPRYAQQQQTMEEIFQKIKDADPRDELVPTTFDPNQMDDASSKRRDHAFDLWRWGDMMKARLENQDSATFFRIDRNLNRLSAALLKGLSDVQTQQLIGQLEKITISRWEIDALVEGQVLKSVRNCNNPIRERLTVGQPNDNEEEVHWVVASGNGSRYPLIQEMLRRRLHVPFIDDGRFTLDERNLKYAVAKGAVLALSTVLAMGTVRVEFDSDLSNCLPFDLAYKDLRTNTNPILYREHTRYDRLEKRQIPIVAIGGANASARKLEKFVLERRFPGDDGFTPYLSFHFPDGIKGDLEVSYDSQDREFTVRDLATNTVGELKDVTDASLYRSPAQRGDL
jgi:molecular chaperone DnaK (HSP70)